MDISGNVTVGNLFRTQPQYQHQGQAGAENASARPEVAPEDRPIVAAKQVIATGEPPEARPDDQPGDEEGQESESREDLKQNAQRRERREQQTDTGRKELSSEEQFAVRRLRELDQQSRSHVSAHLGAAGSVGVGSVDFRYQQGPDGQRYAVAGDVTLQASAASTPEATIAKMKKVQGAAQATADPSSQDRAVAGRAAAVEQAARRELAAQRYDEAEQPEEPRKAEAPSLPKERNEPEKPQKPVVPVALERRETPKPIENQDAKPKIPTRDLSSMEPILDRADWLSDAFTLAPLGVDATPKVPFRAVPELGLPAREAVATMSEQPSQTSREIATQAYGRASFKLVATRGVNEVA
jgi:hypothetical protein